MLQTRKEDEERQTGWWMKGRYGEERNDYTPDGMI
jgi:hypothetical protein